MLRQNPHNVDQWRKRAKLFDDPKKVSPTIKSEDYLLHRGNKNHRTQ